MQSGLGLFLMPEPWPSSVLWFLALDIGRRAQDTTASMRRMGLPLTRPNSLVFLQASKECLGSQGCLESLGYPEGLASSKEPRETSESLAHQACQDFPGCLALLELLGSQDSQEAG